MLVYDEPETKLLVYDGLEIIKDAYLWWTINSKRYMREIVKKCLFMMGQM